MNSGIPQLRGETLFGKQQSIWWVRQTGFTDNVAKAIFRVSCPAKNSVGIRIMYCFRGHDVTNDDYLVHTGECSVAIATIDGITTNNAVTAGGAAGHAGHATAIDGSGSWTSDAFTVVDQNADATIPLGHMDVKYTPNWATIVPETTEMLCFVWVAGDPSIFKVTPL